MEVRLLGPLEVTDDHGRPVTIRGQRPQAALAVLALRPRQLVTTGQLIQALWGTQPPRTARQSVHVFIHQLRKVLSASVLLTQGSSYRLQLAPEQVDVGRFAMLVEQARAARAAGDLPQAWDTFTQALGLWRGQALADFTGEPFAAPERDRLEERRLDAVEEQAQVGLELGQHAQLAGELEALVAQHPRRERLWELLMLARYRAGRQAEALAAYQAARGHLVAQGRTPGEGLRRLERAILSHDPSLEAPQQPEPAALATRAPDRPAAASTRPRGGRAQDQAARAGEEGAAAPRVADPRGQEPPRVAAGGAEQPPPAPTPRPAPAAAWAGAGAAAWGREERRTVTVLAVIVELQQGDPEDVRAQAATVRHQVEALVGRYGGAVQPGAVGPLLAVFGAQRSLEDDPERAVRAALELRAALGDGGAVVRVGVATGTAVVASRVGQEPGGQAPAEQAEAGAGGATAVSVVGDVLDRAMSLAAGAAPGSVIAASRTYWATGQVIAYRPAPSTGEGLGSGEVTAWEALAPRARTGALAPTHEATAAAPLIERERELAILGDVLFRFLRDRQPQLLTVVSEPGLGKTRLVDELGRLVDQAPELVAWRAGRSVAYGAGSLGALAEVIKAHVGILDTDPPGRAADKLGQAVAGVIDDPGEAARVTDQLRGLLNPTLSPASSLHAPELASGWSRFLAATAARRPMVVVFEDLHWAEDPLVEFIDGVIEQVGMVPLLVVCTARPEFLDRHPRWGGGKANAATLSLSPLSEEGTSRLLAALLGDTPLPADARGRLLAAAGGNPLYVEEYARMLTEGRSEAAALARAGAPPVPETVQQLIAARLDLLPPGDKRLLQDAAVIGETGWVGALVAVTGADRCQIEEGLQRLRRRQFLRQVRAPSIPGETEYAFRHTLIREVAYQQLLRSERAEKHQRVAAWLHRLNPDAGDRAEWLAYHYSQALELTGALGWPDDELARRTREAARAAGDRATALGALTAAARHYQRALDLWPPGDPARAELLFRLGLALSWHQQQRREVLAVSRDAFVAAGDRAGAARAEVQLAMLARNSGDPAAAKQHVERAARLDPDDPAVRASLQGARVLELSIQGRYAEAIALGRAAARTAQAQGVEAEFRPGLAGLGRSLLHTGEAQGAAVLERVIALSERVGDPSVHFTRWALANALVQFGDLRRAEVVGRGGRERAIAGGEMADATVVAWYDATLAAVDYQAGRWDAALARGERAAAGPDGEPGYPEPWYRPVRARVRLGRGDLDGALEDAQAGARVSEALGEIPAAQAARALHARALAAAGRNAEAAELLERLLADQRRDPARAAVTPDQVVLMLELEDAGEVKVEGLPEGLWPTRWHQAASLLAGDDLDGAAEAYALMGADADAALVRLTVARRHAAAGRAEPARAALASAVSFWRQAEATAYLRQAADLQAALADGAAARLTHPAGPARSRSM